MFWPSTPGQDPPKFSVVPGGEYRQEAGRELVIPCEAEGDPFPNITWRKVMQPLCLRVEFGYSISCVWLNFKHYFMLFYITFSVFHGEIFISKTCSGFLYSNYSNCCLSFKCFNHILMMSIKYAIKGQY